MAAVTYLFDTNAVVDLLKRQPNVIEQVRAKQANHSLCLCAPVDYEIWRGLLWKKATSQERIYNTRIKPMFAWVPLTLDDWRLAAEYWAKTRLAGKQLADIDLLLASIAHRLGAVIVSADQDLNALGIAREDWRSPPAS